MKWAFDSVSKKLVTLPMLWDLRSTQILSVMRGFKEQGPRKTEILLRNLLNEGVVCPECMNPVHVFALPRVNGFHLAGVQITEPREQSKIGFQHYAPENKRNDGQKNVRECTLYWPDDPRFADLEDRDEKDDPAIKERIRQVLVNPIVKRLNHAVLKALHFQAAKKPMTREDLGLYVQLAQKYFMKHEVMASHPYVLPYAVMGMVPLFTRRGPYGDYDVKYVERGHQELVFRDIEGKDRVAKVPEYMSLAIRKGRSWQPMARDDRRYPITEAASRALAGWDERAVQTTLISMPKDLIGAPVSPAQPDKPVLLPGLREWMGLQKRFKNG